MRLTEICDRKSDWRRDVAVWSESAKGWIMVSDLLRDTGKDTRYLSVSLMLYRIEPRYCKKEDVTASDIREAIIAYDKSGADNLRAYRPGEDGSTYDPLFSSPEKILCVGLNYADHAKEFGDPLPEEPVIFCKASSALSHSGASIVLPKASKRVDYEGELVVVMGETARNVSRENAMSYVAGYCCGNDVSARDWQKGKPAGQWFLGKSFDTFAPVGSHFVTADEIPDPHNLNIVTRLNGEVVQSSNTRNLIFRIDQLISYLSSVMTLRTGDLIFTGTPSGVGDVRTPPIYLKHGDRVDVEIEKIGVLTNQVSDY